MCRKWPMIFPCWLFVVLLPSPARAAEEVTLWCAYTGQEEHGLRQALEAFERATSVHVRLLSIPFGAYASKLEAAIPTGNGPDLFIDAHERLPVFVGRELIAPWPEPLDTQQFLPHSIEALQFAAKQYGEPLSVKSLALYVNEALVGPAPVTSMEALIRLRQRLPRDVYPLAFEAENPYYAVSVLHAFGVSCSRRRVSTDSLASPHSARWPHCEAGQNAASFPRPQLGIW